MATIKSYTDLEQSKVLSKILQVESADMFYVAGKGEPIFIGSKMVAYGDDDYDALGGPDVLCWSLAALLSVLPDGTDIVKDKADTENEKYMCTVGVKDDIISTFGNNPVDACYEMILKLNELKIL